MTHKFDTEQQDPAKITSLEQLHSAILEQQDKLSMRLRQVAAWLLEHPNQVAFSTLAEIAAAAGVHASTLIRFANFLGFSGFSELQRLYKQDLLEITENYKQRILQHTKQITDHPLDTHAANLLQEFASANLLAIEQLRTQANPAQLNAAVETMADADNIHICGFRRVYSVAHYFHYTLSQLHVNSHLVSATGGMLKEQLALLDKSSLLIAITFKPYTTITREAVIKASEKGSKVLLITDSELCPVSNLADHLFVIREAEVWAFRSLNTTLCLAQTLCVALGYQRQVGIEE